MSDNVAPIDEEINLCSQYVPCKPIGLTDCRQSTSDAYNNTHCVLEELVCLNPDRIF